MITDRSHHTSILPTGIKNKHRKNENVTVVVPYLFRVVLKNEWGEMQNRMLQYYVAFTKRSCCTVTAIAKLFKIQKSHALAIKVRYRKKIQNAVKRFRSPLPKHPGPNTEDLAYDYNELEQTSRYWYTEASTHARTGHTHAHIHTHTQKTYTRDVLHKYIHTNSDISISQYAFNRYN